MKNFETFFIELLKSEGGYVDHPKDPGGATNMGITLRALEDWRGGPVTKEDVKSLTKAEAKKIYKSRYWDTVKAGELPSGVDVVTADFAVNSGPHRAVISLQEVLNVAPDGIVGPLTISAAKKARPQDIIMGLSDNRMNFLRKLSTWSAFGNGWEARVKRVRDFGLALAEKANPTKEYKRNGSLLDLILKLMNAAK